MKPPALDYERWDGRRLGVVARIWAISSAGLRQLWGYRFFKVLLFLAWVGGVFIATTGFLISQTLAEGGWLAELAIKGGPRAEAVVRAISALLLVYPDLLVTGFFKAIFWAHSELALLLNLAAMALLVPQLITRDRASHALTIYLSRPLTARDYLLGKLGVIIGVIMLLWTGPLLGGWLLAMVLSPDGVFFSYSLAALGVALAFNAVSLVVVSALALGVSAIARTAAKARLAWIGLWIVMSGIAAHGTVLPSWLRHLSFVSDLHLLRDEIFAMQTTLLDAAAVVPLLNPRFADDLLEAANQVGTDELGGVITMLVIMIGGALALVWGRIKPE